MKNISLLVFTSLMLTACPGPGPQYHAPAESCVKEYSYAMRALAAVDRGVGEDSVEANEHACDASWAAFVDSSMLDSDALPDWYRWHNELWFSDELKDAMPQCRGNDGTSEYHAWTLLKDDEVMRVRCTLKCDGHDPDSCEQPE